MKQLPLILVLLVILAGTGWWAISTIVRVGGFQMSVAAWVFMILGIAVSLVLGVGLMMLSFHSSRSGGDDPAEIDRKDV